MISRSRKKYEAGRNEPVSVGSPSCNESRSLFFFGVAHPMSLPGETMSQWKIKHETKMW